MSNPQMHDTLEKWGLRTDRWYAYPPLASLVLGSWLRVFGVSAAALFAFQILLNCCVQLCLFWICRRLQLHALWPLALGLIFFLGTLVWGMRPEPQSFLCLLLGVAFLLGAPLPNLFASSFFLSMAGAMSPQAGLFAAPLLVASLATGRWRDATWPERSRDLLLFASGLLVTAGLFHLSIGGQWTDFLSDFRKHLSIGVGGGQSRLDLLLSYFHWMTFGVEWLRAIAILGALVLIALALASRGKWRSKLYPIALLLGVLATLVTSIPAGYRLHLLFNGLFLAVALSLPLFRSDAIRLTWLWPAAITALCLLPALPELAAHLFRERDNRQAIQQDLLSLQGRPVYCDSAVAWFVYGWQLPGSVQSLQLTNKFALVPLRPGAVTIIPESDVNNRSLRIMGHTFRSTSLNSRTWRIVPVPAEPPKSQGQEPPQ
ncbi:MAG TPA: hypothetical protein VK961_24170 [Chthoniobacter sp.]|nr:hypothetical protein [Chthoniobacter sp.]